MDPMTSFALGVFVGAIATSLFAWIAAEGGRHENADLNATWGVAPPVQPCQESGQIDDTSTVVNLAKLREFEVQEVARA
jgi:hypothetical protein